MKLFSSLASVMGLWLAVSFVLWLFYRLFRSRDGSKQKRAAAAALALIDEGIAIFGALRARASGQGAAEGWHKRNVQPEDTLRDDVLGLLNGIEAQSAYFERVNAAKKKIQKTFGLSDFVALSEILQIRRDFWAASEIFLMEDIRALGPELADSQTFEALQAEAQSLLFVDGTRSKQMPGQDAVELRLGIAREEARAFQAQIEREIAAELERSRFPTLREIVAGALHAITGAGAALRDVRYLLRDAAAMAHGIARAMTLKGLKGAAEELRRVRTDMPSQFASAFERAGGLARQGGQTLKRHYEFVLEAQELRARYAELLARAPDMSEKGKQFLARLELEKRAEQFRESSGDAFDWARRLLVAGIAYLIAGLQYVQAKVTPAQNKQLAVRLTETSLGAVKFSAREPEAPLRALLLPASAYAGGNRGGQRRAASGGVGPEEDDSVMPGAAPGERGGTLRDLLTGETGIGDRAGGGSSPTAKSPPIDAKPRFSYSEGLKKMSFKDLLAESSQDQKEDESADTPQPPSKKGPKSKAMPDSGGSLIERLASVDAGEKALPAEKAPEQPDGKSWGVFRSKRNRR